MEEYKMRTLSNPLSIHLFGCMDVFTSAGARLVFPTTKASEIFALLVLDRGHKLSRETLINNCWPNATPDKARKYLRTEIWRIRQAARTAGIDLEQYISVNCHELVFNEHADYLLDVEGFEQHFEVIFNSSSDTYSDNKYQQCLDCTTAYRGPLLEPLHNDWCLLRRELLHSQYLMILEYLVKYHQHHEQWNQAIAYALKLLAYDPLLEHIHLILMQCYYNKGNRTAAITQYFSCCKSLREELGISPMSETEIFYRNIISSVHHIDLPAASEKRSISETDLIQDNVKTALADLRNAENTLIKLSNKLFQS